VIKKKVKINIKIKGIKNFLVCFWKIIIRNIENKYNIKGILFPENIIPVKNIIKRIGIK
tara:strand:+ start:434 stop:610 length:177 start_codon:yes stop_codon:yes gene_type:complete